MELESESRRRDVSLSLFNSRTALMMKIPIWDRCERGESKTDFQRDASPLSLSLCSLCLFSLSFSICLSLCSLCLSKFLPA